MSEVHIVGAGLAGTEIAYQLATRGVRVRIHEMRPKVMTPVHKTGYYAELVCSNSLKSLELRNASGLLKREMEILGSVIIKTAKETRVPSGKALAVDRDRFSSTLTDVITSLGVKVDNEEVEKIPDDNEIWVIATGPATSPKFSAYLEKILSNWLYFFDAVAPIISAESIDFSKAFFANRYDPQGKDYLNCPLNEKEYDDFYTALIQAETVPMEDFDRGLLFERCMPVEEIARTGRMSLLYGPMKPVGLIDPQTNRRPYAVVQLRKEDETGSLYNLVGFQTRLKWSEQKRLLRTVPALKNAEIVRYGVMHRNLYVDSRNVLDKYFRLKEDKRIFFAGQITGVEGYLESAASGLYVAMNICRVLKGLSPIELPRGTLMGALFRYVTSGRRRLRPMYASYGLLSPDGKSSLKRSNIAKESIKSLANFSEQIGWKVGGTVEDTTQRF